MIINIKKLHPNAITPHYAKDGDAGLDLTATTRTYGYGYIEYGTGLTLLKFEDFNKDLYVDRVFLKPVEVKELLKSEKALEILKNLIIDGMWKNLWEIKQLDSKKKYFGNKVATIKRNVPGMENQYFSENTSHDEAMIEIRLYSDITEIK